MSKPKLAVYWASSCGGCEVAVVNLHEKLLEIDRRFDFVFCPCLLDAKVKDVEALPDRGIAVTLFNGAIRNGHNLEMARLLRRKSELLVAFGACSATGGIPALSNLHSREAHLERIYGDGAKPAVRCAVAEGELELPEFFRSVRTLADAVEVDYFIPGCPPEPKRVWGVVDLLIRQEPLPPRGTVFGGASSVCRECGREKNEKRIARFVRPHEVVPEPRQCLLEQGLVCMGVVTREGCGALCPEVNMPCTGCYGPAEGVMDQGAKMLSTLGSILDRDSAAAPVDPAGVLYKYSLAASALGKERQ